MDASFLSDAVTQAPRLMARAVHRAAHAMLMIGRASDAARRGALAQAANFLVKQESQLCASFQRALQVELSPSAPQSFDFGEGLSLMDDRQAGEALELSRARQAVLKGCQGALADLDPLVSSVLGHTRVRPAANPLRPDVYIRCLRSAVGQAAVAESMQREWTVHLCAALGEELSNDYTEITVRLREAGVRPAGFVPPPSTG